MKELYERKVRNSSLGASLILVGPEENFEDP
jgi:hypothetical protein